MGFIQELKWRGMLQEVIPETDSYLKEHKTAGYIGFDPTGDSLHVGNLATIMLLVHFQRDGHKPFALVGGATGMIGDPSGKSEERNLLDEATLRHNQEAIRKQLAKFLDYEQGENRAEMVNNYDWMKNFSFLDFARDVGKHITINYMMAKDSVKSRLESENGISFTEFTYQLVQGYDFYHLYKEKDCKVQMGGRDQWGNITTGTELIRRKLGGKAYALVCPLITKSDGTKFGKTEQGNVWLDPEKTSPYKFYQFWLNASDEDAEKYIKVFTLFSESEVETLIEQHQNEPHLRLLQKKLAEDVTVRVHSREAFEKAVEASQILFGKSTKESLAALSESELLDVFEGVPMFSIEKTALDHPIDAIDFLADNTKILSSKGEARRSLKENAISINKQKIPMEYGISSNDLLNNKYILVQKGRKNYFLVKAE